VPFFISAAAAVRTAKQNEKCRPRETAQQKSGRPKIFNIFQSLAQQCTATPIDASPSSSHNALRNFLQHRSGNKPSLQVLAT
jgi:hypothetical protein